MRSTRTVRKRILLPGDRLNKEKYRKSSVDYFVPQVHLVCRTEREIINEIALNTAKNSVSSKKKKIVNLYVIVLYNIIERIFYFSRIIKTI